jgi:hypothetical protein
VALTDARHAAGWSSAGGLWGGLVASWGACLLALLFIAAAPVRAIAAELVMFEEAGCSWCQRWHREVGAGYPLSDEGRRAPLRRLHIQEARRSGVVLAGPVTVTPTFVLVDSGVEVGRITGYPGADFFWGMLAEMLARLAPPRTNVPRDARRGDVDGTTMARASRTRRGAT